MLHTIWIWLLAAMLPSPHAPAQAQLPEASSPRIGVFYYPGWFASAWTTPQNWEPIRTIGDRTPLLGWYDPRNTSVMRQQLAWMHEYGIAYVVFDWTYSNGAEHLGAPIDAYLATSSSGVQFALLWANHDEPTTAADMQQITTTWLRRYMSSPRFLRVDGEPVVFIFSFAKFRDDARASGSSALAYVKQAQTLARTAGLPGIHFIAGVDDSSDTALVEEAKAAGIRAISSYNLHRNPRSTRGTNPSWWKATHGYAALDAAYRAQWEAARSLSLPYVVPMTSGWDKRPWGGSEDPLHDRSIGSAAAFRRHLLAGRQAIAALGQKNDGLGVICCWNEFGEGSFIEPTKQKGFSSLRQVRDVFAKP